MTNDCGKPTAKQERKPCKRCGKDFVAYIYRRQAFCSRSCAKSGRFGADNNSWKGGRRVHKQSGRVTVYKDGKHVFEHRVLVNAPEGMVVHHKDEDPTNNSIDNLVIMSRSEHTRLHNLLSPRRGHHHDEKGRFATRP